ncbi:phage tail assembly chaperone [Bradyrhizobium sp. 41S5]|uniref:phage tail assembly chaperone n=1 Tax=Bradyrhizobium sp. 41S5 TaxID=1404443 RepID=UPI00156AE87E|nr:phage tail assembly chaperone [Bradyrhizobium sp. 41S5]UFX41784.1 phage tail assembly chaperone [Bradyrhizobium sp. 41S5]
MTIIHFCSATGYIRSWGNAEPIDGKSHFPDHCILRTADDRDIDPLEHMVDVALVGPFQRPEDAIVARPDADKRALLIERLALAIVLAVSAELASTDQYMVPDRPVANRDAWAAFRQALRDLSSLSDAPTMARNWPARPDAGAARPQILDLLAQIDALAPS